MSGIGWQEAFFYAYRILGEMMLARCWHDDDFESAFGAHETRLDCCLLMKSGALLRLSRIVLARFGSRGAVGGVRVSNF